MKIITFDLGGTLMEYAGMPASWTDYYKQGFEAINSYYNCKVSEDYIKQSVEILKSFNPRQGLCISILYRSQIEGRDISGYYPISYKIEKQRLSYYYIDRPADCNA